MPPTDSGWDIHLRPGTYRSKRRAAPYRSLSAPPAPAMPEIVGGRCYTRRMASWKDIESVAPEFAARLRACFDAGTNKTLATLRIDGSPRISASESKFEDGELTLGMMGGSRKSPMCAGIRVLLCTARRSRLLRATRRARGAGAVTRSSPGCWWRCRARMTPPLRVPASSGSTSARPRCSTWDRPRITWSSSRGSRTRGGEDAPGSSRWPRKRRAAVSPRPRGACHASAAAGNTPR